jgi:hypothetical protein
VILWRMATEAQKMQLAEAFLRLAREALRPVPSDPEVARDFRIALFECPDGHADVAGLVATLCRPDEVADVLRVLRQIALLQIEPFHPFQK